MTSAVPVGHAFTGLTKIVPGRVAALAEYLTEVGTHIDTTPDFAFSQLKTVHFLRWVVLRDGEGGGWLAFESNYDGALDDHLGELLRAGATAIHRMYGACVGYPLAPANAIGPGERAAVIAFIRQGALPNAAFHVGVHNKSAERIRCEAEIAASIERYVDASCAAGDLAAISPREMYGRIVEHLRQSGLLARAREKQPGAPKSSLWPAIVRIVPAALSLLPLLLVLFVQERLDRQDDPTADPPAIAQLAEREDFQVQNQLTHLVDLKSGPLRRWWLRFVLWAIDLLARFKFNRGALGGITTIHFARWVFIDDHKRLLFFSNYDGSWESYLGDFIDKAHGGLTAVWSNTLGFPKTWFFLGAGATDEERFKSWTRSHQVPTQLWYSAYPELTVFNIQQNARICAGLADEPSTPEGILAWLQSL